MTLIRTQSAISLGVSALIVIGLILIVGFGLFLNATFDTTSTKSTQTTYTTTSSSSVQIESRSQATCTIIPAISYMICPSTLRISAVGTPGASPLACPSPCGSWNFTVTINSSSVIRGQTIELSAVLTNIAPNQTINSWIGPYINPSVYSSNGTEAWAWDPPQVTYENMTIASGETFSQDVSIPTSHLVSGQSYFIEVAPLSIQFPTPNNYTFTFQFSVN